MHIPNRAWGALFLSLSVDTRSVNVIRFPGSRRQPKAPAKIQGSARLDQNTLDIHPSIIIKSVHGYPSRMNIAIKKAGCWLVDRVGEKLILTEI